MIAESLRTDGDLDLANNYLQNDGRLFGHDNLLMELHAARALNGETRSIHALGIAVFILPAYVLAQSAAAAVPEGQLRRFRMGRGLFAYSIVSLFLMAMTALGLGLLAVGLSNVAGARLAAIATIAIGISPPVVSHSFLIFPEAFALFVTCCTVWFVTKDTSVRDERWFLALSLAVGLLPWFHQKYLLYSLGLALVVLQRRYGLLSGFSVSCRATGLALFGVPQVALLLWLRHEWGSFGGALTTGVLTAETIPLTIDSFSRGAVGLLFDRQSGLAAFTPLFWMVPACVWLTWRRTWDVLVPVGCLYVPAAAFVIGWWAGFSPAARYLVPAVPLLAWPVVLALHYRPIRIVATALLACQVVFNALVWQNPRWLWNATDQNRLLEALWFPGRLYSMALAPIRVSGLTVDAIVPISIAIGLTCVLVLLVRADARRSMSAH